MATMASGLALRTRAPAAPARPARAPPRPILNHARDIKPHAHAVASSPLPATSQPLPVAHRSACSSASFESGQFHSSAEQHEHLEREVLLLTPLARQLRDARDADSKVNIACDSRDLRGGSLLRARAADRRCCPAPQLRIVESHARFQAFASSPRCARQARPARAGRPQPGGAAGCGTCRPGPGPHPRPGAPPRPGGRPSQRPCSS
jgi:hypothetical protein